MANVLKDFLCKWRASGVGIEFRIRILNWCILLDASMGLYKLWSQSIDPFAVVIVAFECIAVSETRCSLESNPAASIPAQSIFVFQCHYFFREVAFIHVKIETVHGNQFCESNAVSLSLIICERISEHKNSLFGCMRMKINVYFEGFVLNGLLGYCLLGRPNRRMVSLRWVTVESVQVLPEGIKSVVTSSHSIWIKCRDDFEYIILPQQPSLLASQISYQINCSVKNMRTRTLTRMHS